MSTFKKTKVVMLPTNEKATVGSIVTRPSDNRMATVNVLTKDDTQPCIHQHLYFLSDEEIKDGEYGFCMNLFNRGNQPYQIIFKMDSEQRQAMIELGGQKNANVFKIIATTDKSLIVAKDTEIVSIEYNLPQPSQSFIEKFVEEYNKGNVITEVLVEYHEDIYFQDELQARGKLKINPKDNTITIRKAKDSWSREEVIELLHKRMEYTFGGDYDKSTTDKWIEENL